MPDQNRPENRMECAKTAQPVPAEYQNRVGKIIGDGEVEVTIAVKVGHSDGPRAITRIYIHYITENAIASSRKQ